MPWYKGKALADALGALSTPKRAGQKPLRMPISDVYVVEGVGTVLAGRVEAGRVGVGMRVCVAPSMLTERARAAGGCGCGRVAAVISAIWLIDAFGVFDGFGAVCAHAR